MRHFRHLPPLLQVACILALLFPLASIAVLIDVLIARLSSVPPHFPADSILLILIALNLGLLSGSCSFAVNSYSVRFRRPQGGTFPLESWQSQVRAIALLAILPLGALVLALVLSLDTPAFLLAAGISLLAAIANMLALLWAARVWRVTS